MHAFHDYISATLRSQLEGRCVVVFYDPREEFRPFIEELAATPGEPLPTVTVGGLAARLAEYEGSYFGLRAAVEPYVCGTRPEPLIVYLPGVERDREGSVLMEVERGGACYEPQLKRLARNVLRESYTDGQIDRFLASEAVSYCDVAGLLRQQQEAEAPSLLRTLYENKRGLDLLVAWLAEPSDDARILEKNAATELYQLVDSRIGLTVPNDTSLSDARDRVVRYVLLGEFRMDLQAPPPSSLSMIPEPATNVQRSRVREIAGGLRTRQPAFYQAAADRIESEFRLADASFGAEALGSIDTFRFEADVMLAHAGELVAAGEYERALGLVETHRRSYWVEQDVLRQTQWEACRLMAELGGEVGRVKAEVHGAGSTPKEWVVAYAAHEGWHRVDAAQRVLEAWVASMDEEPRAERALGRVRLGYEALVQDMAEGFTSTLAESGWTIEGEFAQAKVFPELVDVGSGPTAYFLVDALRYEMAGELSRQLEGAAELVLRPAVAALPTVTPVGMAALLPEASASFAVVEHNGKLAARVAEQPMCGLKERLAFFKTKVPDLVDLTLDDALQRASGDLKRRVEGASVVLVRSQEIDAFAEQGFDLAARQMMSTIVGNVARAVRKLANAGVDRFVIAADHGHLFGMSKGEDMRIDAPGGDTVKLTRRCWIGRGGQTPPGTVRVQGAELGYDTDLDFIFPLGAGVFRSGGGLSYHHGGASLQELVVPALSFRMTSAEGERVASRAIDLADVPEAVTNRTFLVALRVGANLFDTEPLPLRVLVLSGADQVGEARMASKAEVDRSKGWVLVRPGTEAAVGLILTREDCRSVRVVVQDPESGRVYTESKEIPVKLSL